MSGTQEARVTGETPGEARTESRLGELDLCRGLAILAVLFIHVSGHFLPALHKLHSHAPPPWDWYALAVPNQDFQWAVPCFLMLSAFVNARSLAGGGDLGRYAGRRVQTALLPYVLWSGVYIVVDALLAHRRLPGPRHILTLLLNGTAHFHLYFFVLVLEMYLLLPLLMPLFRKRPPFWAVALGAVALQGGVYALNRFVLAHEFQGTILWDVLPVALGLWLWSQSDRLGEIRRRGLGAALVVTIAALALYTPLALDGLLGRNPHTAIYNRHLNTLLYQVSEWGFTAGMSVLALALAFALRPGPLTRLLGFLGAESLALYVMHPLAILALDKLGLNRHVGAGAGFIIYYAACLALPLGAAWVWARVKTQAAGARRPA